MSPPQESSIVIAMPSDTHRSRACRVFVRPPSLLILRLTTSIARSARGAQQHVEAVDGLVEDERMVGVPADGEALLVGQAGLLDVDVHVADGADDAHGLVHAASRCWRRRRGGRRAASIARDRADALDVDVGIAADLELEAAIALARDSRRRGAPSPRATPARSRDRGRSPRRSGRRAASQTGRPAAWPRMSQQAMSMPRLDVGMALERGVHAAIELPELPRIFADQVRPQLARGRRARPRRRPAGRTGRAGRPRRGRRGRASVSTRTIVLSNTVTDLPPDHL